jgi:hypothetical protein
VYNKGQEMMEKELNALRIVRNTRANVAEGIIEIDTEEEGEVQLA